MGKNINIFEQLNFDSTTERDKSSNKSLAKKMNCIQQNIRSEREWTWDSGE